MTAQELEDQPAFPPNGWIDKNGGRVHQSVDGPTLLIEFTKAAMQGLATDVIEVGEDNDERKRELDKIASASVYLAKVTLTELAKEMSK